MGESDSDSEGCSPPWEGGALRILHFEQSDILTGGIIRFIEILRRIPGVEVILVTDERTSRSRSVVKHLRKLPGTKVIPVKLPSLPRALRALSGFGFFISATYFFIKYRNRVSLVHTDELLRLIAVGFVAHLIAGKPWLCNFQGISMFSLKDKLIFRAAVLLAKSATVVVTPSSPIKQLLSSYGIPPRKIVVIESGVDPELFRPANSSKAFDCVYVGRLSSEKGVDLLLKAWSIVVKERPHAKLEIVGDGGKLPAVLKELQGNVTFHGWVDYEQVPKLLNRARIFLCPSKSETFCQSLAEALACGLPAIANGLPVFKQLWGDLVVYAEPDPRKWADAILKLMDRGDGGEAGCAKRRSLACRYTWDRAARLMHSLLRGLLGGR